MSEFPQADLNARRAVQDYVMSEMDFGAAEVEAFRAWTEACDGASLSPRATVHAGFMHVEAAHSIAQGNYLYQSPERSPIANQEIHSSIAAAYERFSSIETDDPLLNAAALLGRCSLPFFEAALTGKTPTSEHRARETENHLLASELLLDHYKRTRRLSDVPLIQGMLGYMSLARSASELGCLAMLSPLRCQEAGSVMGRWHVALYDTKAKAMHQVRLGVDAPANTIALLPSLFSHDKISVNHELGFLESLVCALKDPHNPALLPARTHVGLVTSNMTNYVRQCITPHEQADIPADPIAWYETLPAIRSANDPLLNNRLGRSIRILEGERGVGELTPDRSATLAGMYMEYALSAESLAHRSPGEIVATLQYAQELAEEARDNLPPQTIEQFRMACLAPALELYVDMVRGAATESQIDAYGRKLATVAESMYTKYEEMAGEATAETQDLGHLLQEATVALLAVTHPEKHYAALPTSPRQHGSRTGLHGFDFTVWRKVGNEYNLGHFKGAITSDERIPARIKHQIRSAWEVLLLPSALLGQGRPVDKFATLRALCKIVHGEEPAKTGAKQVKRAQREIWPLFHTATEEW